MATMPHAFRCSCCSPRSDPSDRVEVEDLRPPCHGGRDLGAGRLEVLGLAMRIERGLVLVDLHDHVGARILARLEQLVELVSGFVGADLACQGSEYALELAFLTLLDLQGRNQSNGHQSLLLSAIPTLAPRPTGGAIPRNCPPDLDNPKMPPSRRGASTRERACLRYGAGAAM